MNIEGGIILFDRNDGEVSEQVKTLITDINKAGKSAGLTPLFIGIDREAAAVARKGGQVITASQKSWVSVLLTMQRI